MKDLYEVGTTGSVNNTDVSAVGGLFEIINSATLSMGHDAQNKYDTEKVNNCVLYSIG